MAVLSAEERVRISIYKKQVRGILWRLVHVYAGRASSVVLEQPCFGRTRSCRNRGQGKDIIPAGERTSRRPTTTATTATASTTVTVIVVCSINAIRHRLEPAIDRSLPRLQCRYLRLCGVGARGHRAGAVRRLGGPEAAVVPGHVDPDRAAGCRVPDVEAAALEAGHRQRTQRRVQAPDTERAGAVPGGRL